MAWGITVDPSDAMAATRGFGLNANQEVLARSESHPMISVVVPTLDEAASLGDLLQDLAALTVPYEVIIADGGSTDETVAIARAAGARVVLAPTGRGLQLRAGAEAARADVLCFLHADVRMAASAAARLAELASARPPHACVFRLRVDAAGAWYRSIDAGANLRTRLLGLPYGDQGLVVRRDDYEKAGGYPPIPLMEDVALARALRRVTRIRLLDVHLRVSPRRWKRDGVLRRTLMNWILLARYLAGTSPERLVKRYCPETRLQ
jgi:rSAM/selenodomain-associated transferase 2